MASLILLKTIAFRTLVPGRCHLCRKLFALKAPQNIFSFRPVPWTRPMIPFRMDSQMAGILFVSGEDRRGVYPTRIVGRNSLMSPLQLRVEASVRVFTVA